jgi:hypothetical protein
MRHLVSGLFVLAVFTAGTMSATVIPYNYTTTGTIAGSHPNIVFNPAGKPSTYDLSGDITGAASGIGVGISPSAVPEPSSIFLLLTVPGGAGLAMPSKVFSHGLEVLADVLPNTTVIAI